MSDCKHIIYDADALQGDPGIARPDPTCLRITGGRRVFGASRGPFLRGPSQLQTDRRAVKMSIMMSHVNGEGIVWTHSHPSVLKPGGA